jgi:hypothetical protein
MCPLCLASIALAVTTKTAVGAAAALGVARFARSVKRSSSRSRAAHAGGGR